jgi:carbonic anhydrase/acetyltransferase-like protein (isoleucine patch superfamily)
MHAYLLSTGRSISPFNRPVGELKVHGRELQCHQPEILRELGCTVERIDDPQAVRQFPCLLIHDDLYFTHSALAGFIDVVRRGLTVKSRVETAVKTSGEPAGVQAAMRVSELTERFASAFQGKEVAGADGVAYRAYDCYYLRRADWANGNAQAELAPIGSHVKKLRTLANPYFEPSGKFTLPISRVFMAPITHWAGLMSANILGMPDFFLSTAKKHPIETAAMPLLAAWRSGSMRPSRWLAKTYFAGPKCHIYPSAHIEGAIIGRRVRIGPNAVIRGAVIGDETEIGPNAIVEGCTLGNRVSVNGHVIVRCCTVDDEASIGTFFNQLSVFGRSSVLCPDAGIYDFQFKGSVRVEHEGHSAPSGSRILGGCLGDRAFMGPGVHLLCGQELPNDCILVKNPQEMVRGVEKGMPDCVVRIDRAGRDELRRLRRAS